MSYDIASSFKLTFSLPLSLSAMKLFIEINL